LTRQVANSYTNNKKAYPLLLSSSRPNLLGCIEDFAPRAMESIAESSAVNECGMIMTTYSCGDDSFPLSLITSLVEGDKKGGRKSKKRKRRR
jgi:hypothetical protein